MSLPSLYALTEQYRSLQALAASEDCDEQALADTLEGLQGDIQIKGANVAAVYLNMVAMHSAMIDAAKRITERAGVLDRKAEHLRQYLKTAMQATGVTKIETPELVAAIRKNPPSVAVTDEGAVPDRFKVTPEPPPPRVDKKAVLAALKAGEDVPGCSLNLSERVDIR